MSHTIKTIAQVSSGELLFCTACKLYHLTFNNIHFEFTPNEYKQFKKYLFHIDIDYWEEKYSCHHTGKNIPIPSLQKNLVLIFNRKEIQELKVLFSSSGAKEFQTISLDDINYTLVLN